MNQYKVDRVADAPAISRTFPPKPCITLAEVAVGNLKRWGYKVGYDDGKKEFSVDPPISEFHKRVLDQVVTYPFGVLEVK